MLRVNYSGRTANCCIQYMYARLVAENNRYRLWNEMPSHVFINPTPAPEGLICDGTEIYIDELNKEAWLPPDEVKLDGLHCYYLSGLFQKHEYYVKHRDRILKFFNLPYPKERDTKNVAIHVRLDDYARFGSGGTIVDPSYYTDILSSMRCDKVFIFTDSPENRTYFENFDWRGCEIVTGLTDAESFNMMMGFDRLIIGNSSFAWLAAFLGGATKVKSFGRWLRNCTNYRPTLWRVGEPVYGKFLVNEDVISKKVSIIIPYRQRGEDQSDLDHCLAYLQSMYPEAEIIVCEQNDHDSFKKGQLVNLGFQRSTGEIIVMHDVDARLKSKVDFVELLLANGAPVVPFYSINGKYRPKNWGMINVWWREQFADSFGFSNLYTGWGGEDDEMHRRSLFVRALGDITHIDHPKYAKDIVETIYDGKPIRRNSWLLMTRGKRKPKYDSWEQTDAKEDSVLVISDNIKKFSFSKIGVDYRFEYNDFLFAGDNEDKKQFEANLISSVGFSRVDMGILTYQRHMYLSQCLKSLFETVTCSRSNILIFDDNSQHPKQDEVLQWARNRVRVKRNEVTLGPWHNFIHAADEIYKRTAGRWFVMGQDDIVFAKDWVKKTEAIIELLTKKGVDWGMLSLINFHGKTDGIVHIMDKGHQGAACLVINKKMWTQFMRSDAREGAEKKAGIDHRLAHWCRNNGQRDWAVCHVAKSLVKHIGVNSTLHSRPMDDFVGLGFEG